MTPERVHPGSLPDHDLLIVSDLHLSEGRPPGVGKFSANEDFFFDEAFARFLAYHDAHRGPRARWHLLVNGDFVDFLQVVATENAPPDLVRGRESRKYGLACGERESAYKLDRVAAGHWVFFEALAGFVASGNAVTVIRGNHDVEFHYGGVQQAFLRALRAAFAGRAGRDPQYAGRGNPARIDVENVRFADWFYYEDGLLWVEHGNRYDGLNSFKYWLSPLMPKVPGWPAERKDEIDLPFGALFVRYLFNRLEVAEPFADNVKPPTRFVGWLITRHPATALKFILGDGRHMLDRVRRAWRRLPPSAWFEREKEHLTRLDDLATGSNIDRALLGRLDASRAPSLLKEPPRWSWLVRPLLATWVFLPLVVLATAVLAGAAALAVSPLLVSVLPGPAGGLLASWCRALAESGLLEALRWAALPFLLAGAVWLVVWLLAPQQVVQRSELARRAGEIAAELGVKYVVMGHTHDAEMWHIGSKGEEYFNTGTWTKVFSQEERLVREDVEFVFVEGVRRGSDLRVKLLEWDDAAGESRLLKLFRGAEERASA